MAKFKSEVQFAKFEQQHIASRILIGELNILWSKLCEALWVVVDGCKTATLSHATPMAQHKERQ